MSGILLDSSVIIAAERRQVELGAITAGRLDLTYVSVSPPVSCSMAFTGPARHGASSPAPHS